jgi:hypothetical protein
MNKCSDSGSEMKKMCGSGSRMKKCSDPNPGFKNIWIRIRMKKGSAEWKNF